MSKITFNDLDGKLKIAVVIAYVIGIMYAIVFIIGFIQAII